MSRVCRNGVCRNSLCKVDSCLTAFCLMALGAQIWCAKLLCAKSLCLNAVVVGGILLSCCCSGLAIAQDDVNYNKALVPQFTLPDPLVANDGTRIETAAQWQTVRRPELLAMFEQQMFGRAPSKPALRWKISNSPVRRWTERQYGSKSQSTSAQTTMGLRWIC